MERIGVRAFRERLSSYLGRVERGESMEITDRGRVVARLEPPQRSGDALDQLIDEGIVIPPRTRGGLEELPLPPGRASSKGSDALDELREERF